MLCVDGYGGVPTDGLNQDSNATYHAFTAFAFFALGHGGANSRVRDILLISI